MALIVLGAIITAYFSTKRLNASFFVENKTGICFKVLLAISIGFTAVWHNISYVEPPIEEDLTAWRLSTYNVTETLNAEDLSERFGQGTSWTLSVMFMLFEYSIGVAALSYLNMRSLLPCGFSRLSSNEDRQALAEEMKQAGDIQLAKIKKDNPNLSTKIKEFENSNIPRYIAEAKLRDKTEGEGVDSHDKAVVIILEAHSESLERQETVSSVDLT